MIAKIAIPLTNKGKARGNRHAVVEEPAGGWPIALCGVRLRRWKEFNLGQQLPEMFAATSPCPRCKKMLTALNKALGEKA